ncbi:hypothetical protein MNEG_14579 [Monoraphidium neglectum]|uniref:Uncharacterized protein n=1 Tax=Monoraphidium neglectum TaxID=145388 RepID=A0A0D2KBW8_9CHLO|nr:hypothetical protein MNEG_14579 [Monoraphidium neglectum]KIY93383.1 hypothetical protein MNEG_14579 [Monoraphidium neglectum]|eukprot:XP_013892403.1 hypothetical protein MNEG_14579 [Monoraphidium neglectum]
MQARLRGAAGRVGPALTSALLSLGCDEVGARLGDGSEQLTPGAGSEVLAVSALMAGALAALRGAAGGAGAAAREEVEEAARLVEALQREVEAALQAKPAAAAEGEGAEAAEAAAPGPPPSLAPLRELAARIAALPAPGGDGAGEEGEGAEGLLAEMRNDIGVRVSESTAALGARADAAVSAMRDRERAARVLRRGQLIIADDASLDAAAAGERPSSPIKRLAYAEAYLKQLGGRSLGGALPDATAFLSGVGGPAGIGGGLDLDPAGAEGAAQLQTLLDEMSLIDDVIKLELGPDTAGALTRITAYLDARDAAAEAEAEAAGGGDAGAEGGAVAAAVVAVTPRLDKEREAANKCREAIAQLAEDPLVQLGLSTAQYRVLAALREAAAAVRGGAADAGAYERGVGALRQVASQLGDIGAAIQVKVAATGDDALRGVLVAQKERAVDLYQRLQAFLSYEDNTRAPALAAVRALKASADAAVAEGSSAAAVQAALAKAEAAEQQVASLYTLLEKLPSPSSGGAAPDAGSSADHAAAVAEATAALNAIGDAAGKLRAELAGYAAYATLRERALATLARASGAAGAPALPEAAGGDKGGVVAPLAELEPELNAPLRSLPEVEEDELAGWEAAGFRAIARGQVAAVLVATGLVPGAAAAAAAGDAPAARATEPAAGLPSGKAPLQLYAERILRLQRLAAAAAHGANAPVARPIQFVIMTSPDTHAQALA